MDFTPKLGLMWGKEVENHWSTGKTRVFMALFECAMESVTTVYKNDVTISFRRRKKYSGACSRYEEINTNDISIIPKVTLGDQPCSK